MFDIDQNKIIKGSYSVDKSTILLTTTKVFLVQALSSSAKSHEGNFCSLRWKCGILWVKRSKNHNSLAALQNLIWLRKCLKNSSAKLVCIDLSLGEPEIKYWADSCRQVKKKIFVRLDSASRRSKIRPTVSWIVKRASDRIIAVLLLLLLSPVFLVLIVWLHLKSQSSIFSRDWKIGKGGKLFQALRFQLSEDVQIQGHSETGDCRAISIQNSSIRLVLLDRWMKKYGLDKLPQLINVLWGEMSIVGPRALTLYDAIQINSRHIYYLHCLPGILNPCPGENNQPLLDVRQSIYLEYKYLEKWNLMKDIKILSRTLFKSFSNSVYF
jgi:lipopolysaccharide/colanic/teichoic acid biosynthesis glycosyltransferase